jgi:hypothetical protein
VYIIKQLDFAHLSSAVLKDYRAMLDERNWRYLKNNSDPNIIVLGVLKDDVPIGIASGEVFKDLEIFQRASARGEIYQIFIKPEEINSVLINDLLNQLEQFFKSANCVAVSVIITPSEITESVLKERGWIGPRSHVATYHFDAPSFTAPWYETIFKIPLPEGFEIFKWKDIKKSEWEAVKTQAKQGILSEEINPLNIYAGPVETLNSLGLRYHNEIIGWIITHRVKNALRYTSFFIQPAFQKLGLAPRLLAESMKLQQKSPIKVAMMEINMRLVEPSWLRFIDKHLAPYSQSIHSEIQYWLELKKKRTPNPS